MKTEVKKLCALFLRENKENKHKINLIDYIQDRICKYATQEGTPAEQVKGMNRISRDVINLPDEVFENRE